MQTITLKNVNHQKITICVNVRKEQEHLTSNYNYFALIIIYDVLNLILNFLYKYILSII